MALNLEAKKVIVKEVAEIADRSSSAVAAQYTGMDMSDMTELYSLARNTGVYLRVVRNTLARRALEGTHLACMCSNLKGQLILAFSTDEPGAAAKLVRDFAKDNEKLVVKLVALEGGLLPASDIDRLADLPNKTQALSLLMGAMLAPLSRLIGTLAEPYAKLARTLRAVAASR